MRTEAKHDWDAGERFPDGLDEYTDPRAVPCELGVGQGALLAPQELVVVEVLGVEGKVAQVLRFGASMSRVRRAEKRERGRGRLTQKNELSTIMLGRPTSLTAGTQNSLRRPSTEYGGGFSFSRELGSAGMFHASGGSESDSGARP